MSGPAQNSRGDRCDGAVSLLSFGWDDLCRKDTAVLQRPRTSGPDLHGDSQGPDLGPRGLTWIPRSLGPGVHALLATSPPKNNHGVVAGNEAALIIDAGITPQVSRMIHEQAGIVTSSPVRYLVNTSHRGDHSFGNAAFPAGVQILASTEARRRCAASPSRRPGIASSPGQQQGTI